MEESLQDKMMRGFDLAKVTIVVEILDRLNGFLEETLDGDDPFVQSVRAAILSGLEWIEDEGE